MTESEIWQGKGKTDHTEGENGDSPRGRIGSPNRKTRADGVEEEELGDNTLDEPTGLEVPSSKADKNRKED